MLSVYYHDTDEVNAINGTWHDVMMTLTAKHTHTHTHTQTHMFFYRIYVAEYYTETHIT